MPSVLDTETTIKAVRAYEANDPQAFIETGIFDDGDHITVFFLEGVITRQEDAGFWLKVVNQKPEWEQVALFMYIITVKDQGQAKTALAEISVDGPIFDMVRTMKTLVAFGYSPNKFKQLMFKSVLQSFTNMEPVFLSLMNIKKAA